MLALFGHSANPFDGTVAAAREFIYPEDRDHFRAELEQAIQERSSFLIDYRIIRSDSRVRTLRSRGDIIVDDAGQPVRAIGLVQDVTEASSPSTRFRTAPPSWDAAPPNSKDSRSKPLTTHQTSHTHHSPPPTRDPHTHRSRAHRRRDRRPTRPHRGHDQMARPTNPHQNQHTQPRRSDRPRPRDPRLTTQAKRPTPTRHPANRQLLRAVPATSSISVVYQPSMTWMIVFPDACGASGPNAAGASANGRTAPTFEVSRPSRSRWASSTSWERSASTTKKIARPFSGWIVGGSIDGDERAAGAYERSRTFEDVTADHVEHHVGLAGVLHAVGLQVHKLLDSKAERTVPVGGPAGSDHPGADLTGKLHSERADAARGAVDQCGLPGEEVGVVAQGLPCRQSGDHRSGGDGMVDARWQRREITRLDRHVLRKRAVAGPVGQPEHSLPDGQAGGPVAQFGDDTRHLVPGHARRPVPAAAISPRPRPGQLPWGEPSGMHAHDDVVLGGVRVWQVRQGQPSQTSVAVADGDGLQRLFLSDGGDSVSMGVGVGTGGQAEAPARSPLAERT